MCFIQPDVFYPTSLFIRCHANQTNERDILLLVKHTSIVDEEGKYLSKGTYLLETTGNGAAIEVGTEGKI